jgi:hypothetical protein
MSATCAASGCDRPVPNSGRPGRPAIYCSAQCRPSGAKTHRLVVEIDAPSVADGERPSGRVFRVRLRRGARAVVVADGLGRLAATAFALDIEAVVTPNSRGGGAIE